MREENAVDRYFRVDAKTKILQPTWMYRDVLPYSLGPDGSRVNNNTSIPITSADPVTIPFKLPHSSLSMDNQVGNPLEIEQITFDEQDSGGATSDLLVFIADQGDQRQYMNFPIHIRTLAGSGQLSARLAENLFLPTRHQLLVTFQKTTGAANQHIFFYFHGKIYDTWSTSLQKYPNDHAAMVGLINQWLERRKFVTPYWLTTPNGPVTVQGNQSVEVETSVGDEGHFESTHILRAFTGGSSTSSPFEVTITNPQTRQAIMNGAIHSYMIGDAYNPQPFPCSLVTPAGQLLRFRITNLGTSAITIYLTFRGRKWRCPIVDIDSMKKKYGMVVEGTPQPFRRAEEMRGVKA